MASRRRQRRPPADGDFEDPLKNYESVDPEDALTNSLLHGKVSQMRIKPFMSVLPDATIASVITDMAQMNIACVMIEENAKLAGIFSERDVLTKIADRFNEIKDQPVRTVMTLDPVAVYDTDSPAKALNLMAIGGFRHIPVVNVDDQVVGILGPNRVTEHIQTHFEGN